MADHEFLLQIPAETRYLSVVGSFIGALLDRIDDLTDVEEQSYNIQLAVHEICANIIDHSYGQQSGTIDVRCVVSGPPPHLSVELCDSGPPPDLSRVREPDLLGLQVRGYGLFLARSLMDTVDHRRLEHGNSWLLTSRLTSHGSTTPCT